LIIGLEDFKQYLGTNDLGNAWRRLDDSKRSLKIVVGASVDRFKARTASKRKRSKKEHNMANFDAFRNQEELMISRIG